MKLEEYGKTYIEVQALQEILGEADYLKFAERVEELVEQGTIVATKQGRETNGKYPPLAKKYKIVKQEGDLKDFRDEIARLFPLNYDRSYYRRKPQEYEKSRDMILALCRYHVREDQPLNEEMSINERSLDIFGQEKFLASVEGANLLRNLGLTESYLNIYRTPEPFIYHQCQRPSLESEPIRPLRRADSVSDSYTTEQEQVQAQTQTQAQAQEACGAKVLIIENKDTWYTMRRLALEGIGPFDMLIYGEGKKILSSIEELHLHDHPILQDPATSYFYFGDLDNEGLWILMRLKEKFDHLSHREGQVNGLEPWMEGYNFLIEAALVKNNWRLGLTQKHLGISEIEGLLPRLGPGVSGSLAALFSQNKYMPQEAMHHGVLRRLWT